ncbi:Carbonyl reductase [NADPH] 3 [Chamberlinius hualienensis]
MAAKRVAIVTGSNKGIGFAAVKGLCTKFDGDVFLTSRDETRGLAAQQELQKLGLSPKFHQLDIDDVKSVERLRDFIKKTYGGLDVLINNAAIAFKNNATEPFADQARITIATNYLSHLKVCEILFPILRPHARVVNVSSMLGQLSVGIKGEELKKKFLDENLTVGGLTALVKQFVDDTKNGVHLDKGWGNSAYSSSKVGLTALTRIHQREFNNDPREDIIVTAPEPGYVDTDMSSHKGSLTPDQGAEPLIFCALLPHGANEFKGAYVSQKKEILKFQ